LPELSHREAPSTSERDVLAAKLTSKKACRPVVTSTRFLDCQQSGMEFA
jgi:hypothetical protein